MNDGGKPGSGEWGHFLLLILMLPILPFVYIFSVIGSGLFQGADRLVDKTGERADRHPEAYLNLYYLFVVGAIVGFLFLFGVLP